MFGLLHHQCPEAKQPDRYGLYCDYCPQERAKTATLNRCSKCPDGSIPDKLQANCVPCAPGHYATAGGGRETRCHRCPLGRTPIVGLDPDDDDPERCERCPADQVGVDGVRDAKPPRPQSPGAAPRYLARWCRDGGGLWCEPDGSTAVLYLCTWGDKFARANRDAAGGGRGTVVS